MGFFSCLIELIQDILTMILFLSWILFHLQMTISIHDQSKEIMFLGGGWICSSSYVWYILFVTKIFFPDVLPDWFHSNRLFIKFLKVFPFLAKRRDFCDRLHLHNVLKNEDDTPSIDLVKALTAAYREGVNQEDHLNETPVDIAFDREVCKSNSIPKKVFEILFHAAPNYARRKRQRHLDRLPLHIIMTSSSPSAYLICSLTASYPQGVHQTDYLNKTAIDIAIERETRQPNTFPKEVWEVLFRAASNFPRPKEGDGLRRCPLHIVMSGESPSAFLIKSLVATYPEDVHVKDNQNHTPIDIAIRRETRQPNSFSKEVWEVLFNAASKYPRQEQGDCSNRYPLHVVLESKSPSEYLIKALVSLYPDDILQKDYLNNTPIDIAIKREMDQPNIIPKEIWEVLFRAAPHYPGEIKGNLLDRLPLHLIMESNQPSVNLIEALIAAFPEGVQQRDNLKYTPLDLAITNEAREPNSISREVFDILFNAAPNYPRQKLDEWDQYPLSYILLCCDKKGPFPTNLFLHLLKLNPLAAQEDVYGLTLPIHEVLEFQDTPQEVIEALLKAYPKCAEKTGLGNQLPIHIACQHGASVGAVKALVKAMPQGVTMRDDDNRLPIHYYIQRKEPNLHVIGALMEASPPGLLLERIGSNNNTNTEEKPTMLQALCHHHGGIVDGNNKPIGSVGEVLAFVAHKAICKLSEASRNKDGDDSNLACNILFHTLQLDPTIIRGQANSN